MTILFYKEAMIRIGNYPQISTGIGGDDFFIYNIGKFGGIISSMKAINYIRRHPQSCCVDSSYRIKHAYALKEFYELMQTKIDKDDISSRNILDKFMLVRLKSLLKNKRFAVIKDILKHYENSQLPLKTIIKPKDRVLWRIEKILNRNN